MLARLHLTAIQTENQYPIYSINPPSAVSLPRLFSVWITVFLGIFCLGIYRVNTVLEVSSCTRAQLLQVNDTYSQSHDVCEHNYHCIPPELSYFAWIQVSCNSSCVHKCHAIVSILVTPPFFQLLPIDWQFGTPNPRLATQSFFALNDHARVPYLRKHCASIFVPLSAGNYPS